MKKKYRLLTSSLVVLSAQSTATIAQACTFDYVTPYVGADVSWRYQEFPTSFGGNITKRNFVQGDVYAGLKFCDYIGLQVGFQGSPNQHKTTNISGPFTLFGVPEVATGVDQYQTSSEIYGWHLDLVGFYPFCIGCEKFNLIGSVGFIQNRINMKFYPSFIDSTPLTATQISNNTIKFGATKIVARLTLGIQYLITDCAGIRFIAAWENTSKFKNIRSRNTLLSSRLTLKDSASLGIGFFYNF